MANKIAHPSHHVKKTYIATLDGRLSEVQMKKFSEGVVIDSKKTLPTEIELFDFSENQYKISIYEGRNRQIRKMIEVLGRNVRELKRISIGKIKLGRIVEGKYRKLTEEEKNYLFDL